MSQEQVLGIVRHILTFVGGLLIMYGVMDKSMLMDIMGAVTTLIGVIWSIIIKSQSSSGTA